MAMSKVASNGAEEAVGIAVLRDTGGDGRADLFRYFGEHVGTAIRAITAISTSHPTARCFVTS